MNIQDKIVIVTGANSGMGMATVAAMSDLGATVIMLCRDAKRGTTAYEKLKEVPERNIDLMLCDLGDYTSIRNFVSNFFEKYGHLDILINNAGFISLDRQLTNEGMERQFGVNHLGHFLLTMLLQKRMPRGSRIVIVGSGAHKVGKIHFEDVNLTKGYNVVKAYSQSKLANLLFARTLANHLVKRGITVNCAHPGAVATNMGIDRETGFGKTITSILKPFFLTPEEGARTAVYLATSDEVADISGAYFYKCKIAKSSARSKNMQDANRLYALSKELTHL